MSEGSTPKRRMIFGKYPEEHAIYYSELFLKDGVWYSRDCVAIPPNSDKKLPGDLLGPIIIELNSVREPFLGKDDSKSGLEKNEHLDPSWYESIVPIHS